MTRVISIIGGKGGVGKTIITSNLATTLAQLGNEVIAIDANVTTPNLGLHTGYHMAPNNLHDILKGKSRIRNAMYTHPLGFKIIPGSMSVSDLENVDVGRLPEVTLNLIGKSDFILLDSAAGLGREAVSSITAADEVLIVTNPDMPSVADALKVINIAKKKKKKVIGVVVNRRRSKWHELRREEIEQMLSIPILAEIPEDNNLPMSVTVKRPIVNLLPDSPASLEMKRLAHNLCNKEFVYKKPEKTYNLVQKLARWLMR
jgi:septum site-determining protein MinD